jgi:hypothetical protein
MTQDEHPISHEHRFLNGMGHHKDRDPLQLPDFQQLEYHPLSSERVQRSERFIEQ